MSDTDQTGLDPRPRSLLRCAVFPALCLSLSFVALVPMPEVACPKDRANIELAARREVDANAEREARPARAAEIFGEVAAAYPECPAYHRRRMTATLSALEAHRAAFDADGQRSHLEAALAEVERYLDSLRTVYGDNAAEGVGYGRVEAEGAALRLALPVEAPPVAPPEAIVVSTAQPDETTPPPSPSSPLPPSPPRKSWRGPMVGGGLAVGGGAILLVAAIATAVRSASLERQVEAAECTASLPGDCAELDRRGRVAHRVAIASAIGASVLVAAGVSLLGVGARRRASETRLAATLHPRFVGLAVQGRF